VTASYNTEAMELSLDLIEVPVKIAGEDYVLVELTGKGRDAYMNNLGARMRVKEDGSPAGIKNFDGLQADLVTRCLKKIKEDGTRGDITPAVIQGWPARVQTALFDRAKEISGLSDDAEEKAKND
jgi:hypothetical protein